jgi:hypothetical protein
MKDHLIKLLCTCAPEDGFTQDAIEYAILFNQIPITGDFDTDVKQIMSQYDAILANFRKVVTENEAILLQSYAPLLNMVAVRKDQIKAA